MAIARVLSFRNRYVTTFSLVISLLGTGLIVLQPAAAAGTPLLAIGADVVAADSTTATYAISVTNAGNGEATSVRVTLAVPDSTTFESSSPEPAPVDGGVIPTCESGGTREMAGTSCQWLLDHLRGGAISIITVVLNVPSSPRVDFAPEVTGKDPSTGGDISPQTDSDTSLVRSTFSVNAGHDTFVSRTEPANTNHGQCPVLTTRSNGTSTAFVDLASDALAGMNGLERVWDAQLQATVAASDYSAASPGTLALHAITSGDWAEGETANCSIGSLGSGAEIRTGTEPSVRTAPSAAKQVAGIGPISWTVTDDLDGAAERAAFQGWEIRNTTGFGSLDLSSAEASDDATHARVTILYTTQEAGRCIDLDPEFSTHFPSSEPLLTARVMKSSGSSGNYQATKFGTFDACNGTPAAGQLVHWKVDRELNEPVGNTSSPDVYIANQAGTAVPKSGTTDAGPDIMQTTTDATGLTFIGIRLATPQASADLNRIAGCLGECTSGTGASRAREPDPEQTCSLTETPPLGTCPPSTATGESASEDDATLQWSTTAPSPDPSGSTAPQGPPTLSSFSPTAGPVGTSVIINGNNFTGTTAVRFNGRTASFTVNSPARITTTVPTGATDGPISVQTSAGTTMSAVSFDVTPGQASPSPAPSESGMSASPSSTTGPPGLSPVSLTLSPSVQQSVAFSELTLSGTLRSNDRACAQPGARVEILKHEAETGSFDHLAYTSTGVGGLFEHKVTPEVNTMYSAVIGEHATCDAGASAPATVLVSPKISAKTTAKQVEAGRRFWLTGSVLPEHQLTAVTIWRKTGPGRFKRIGRDFLDASSRYALAIRYRWKKPVSVFLVRWKATDADHVSGNSPRLRVELAR